MEAQPSNGGEFLVKLVAKDDGWLCSLYDALARIRGPVRDYLTDPSRMKRFYTAVRGRITSPGPARPGVPLQHGHDALYDAPADRSRRQAPYTGTISRWMSAFHQPTRRPGTMGRLTHPAIN